ncbi:hypothetical protein [Aliikangiella coralliicola]|uniref:Uncharacterized protein n=1 Tax=Aliikangiella coralliicola TaxID=2592383 RepID=A0A545UB80_9GAMM|nr:hypothetical protein [Aliikangiella coralliicola]TQV86721.1 hypothetical protein FLL46_17675 [Aliikangiella coralliicola]
MKFKNIGAGSLVLLLKSIVTEFTNNFRNQDWAVGSIFGMANFLAESDTKGKIINRKTQQIVG